MFSHFNISDNTLATSAIVFCTVPAFFVQISLARGSSTNPTGCKIVVQFRVVHQPVITKELRNVVVHHTLVLPFGCGDVECHDDNIIALDAQLISCRFELHAPKASIFATSSYHVSQPQSKWHPIPMDATRNQCCFVCQQINVPNSTPSPKSWSV